MEQEITYYCLGFAFSLSGKTVMLIKKNRPEWQKGKLNGIGGRVEDDEMFYEAMVRECREETGLNISIWTEYAILSLPKAEIHVFHAFTNDILNCHTLTDEKVLLYGVKSLTSNPHISNLPWLIAAALDDRFGDNIGALKMKVDYA